MAGYEQFQNRHWRGLDSRRRLTVNACDVTITDGFSHALSRSLHAFLLSETAGRVMLRSYIDRHSPISIIQPAFVERRPES